jgi:hypothetical protein
MKLPLAALFIILSLLSTGRSLLVGQQCSVSVLGNLDCGFGRATCFSQQSGPRGVVSCTCTANCLSPNSIQGTVRAMRGFSWGQNSPCAGGLTGKAWAESAGWEYVTIVTGVHAQDQVSGGGVIGILGGSHQEDCFYGIVEDDPEIKGLC